MASNERMAQFDAVLKKINSSSKYKNDNDQSKLISKLSDQPINVESISSGSMVLNQILGGGLAKGRLIEIYGPESSGKTSIALTAVGNVQKEGGTAVLIDAENAFDPRYASKLGVKIDELAVSQPSSAEQALDLLQDLTESGVVDIIVLDSVAALVPTAELEGDAGDHTIGLLARLMSKTLRKLIGAANKSRTTVIFINQTRDNIGAFSPFGTPQTTPGGKALKFYASQRIEIKKGAQIKGDGATDKGEIIGNEVKFKIVKNKVAPPFGAGSSVLTFNQGINVPAEMIEVGTEYGVIDRPNSRTYVEVSTGEIIGRSKADALTRLREDDELLNRLIVAVQNSIADDLHGVHKDSDVSAKTESEDTEENEDTNE